MNQTLTFSEELSKQLQSKLDDKTKPVGSLGQLESIAIQVGLIQGTSTPDVSKPKAFVFGADHGVCEEGVNPFPQVVTEQMLANFAAGGAAMSVFCKTNEIPLEIINMGIINEQARWPNVQHHAVAPGTRNLRTGAAMTSEQRELALATGAQLAKTAVKEGHNLLIIGEMGIGNSTSASAILAALTQTEPSQAVGPGTGANKEQQALKAQVIAEAIERCKGKSALGILAEVGGFEIAAMVGVLLQAAELKTPVMVDGFIATSAALIAETHNPGISQYWIFAHESAEPAHQTMLQKLNAKPLITLGLRLGEGTGAALAYPLVKNAVAMLNEMATFASAGISDS